MYHIARDGTQLGTFSEEEVIKGLEKGDILGSDQLWTEGMEDWQPVHEVIEADEDDMPVGSGAPVVMPVPAPESRVLEPEALEEKAAAELEPLDAGATQKVSRPVAREAAESDETPVRVPEKPVRQAVAAVAAVPAEAAAPAVVYRSAGPSVALGQYGTAGAAIASMVLGILSLIGGFFSGIPAIICGHVARGTIRRSGGAYGGDGLAVTGLILGYVMSTLMLLWLALLIGGVHVPLSDTVQGLGKEYHVRAEGRELARDLKQYAARHANHFPASLELLGDDKGPDADQIKRLQKTDFGPSWSGPVGWDYLGGTLPDSDAGDRPLLISRAIDASGRHLVIYEDATADKAEVQIKKH